MHPLSTFCISITTTWFLSTPFIPPLSRRGTLSLSLFSVDCFIVVVIVGCRRCCHHHHHHCWLIVTLPRGNIIAAYAWKEIFPTSLARNIVGGHHNTLRSALAASETLIGSIHYSIRFSGGIITIACIRRCVCKYHNNILIQWTGTNALKPWIAMQQKHQQHLLHSINQNNYAFYLMKN